MRSRLVQRFPVGQRRRKLDRLRVPAGAELSTWDTIWQREAEAMGDLTYDVFVNEPPPQDGLPPNGEAKRFYPMASTLTCGAETAVFTDSGMTVDQAHALGDCVAGKGRKVTDIFITDGYGDHWFAAGLVAERFEAQMPTIHLTATTTATPEQFIAALTDFGPRRAKIWGNSADGYLKVHGKGATEADVTEGSRGVWERLHYDWSDPNCVVLTTIDSNVWGGNSGHTYRFVRRAEEGTTDVDAVVVRDPKNLKGRVLGVVIGTIGKGPLQQQFTKSVRAIEDSNKGAGTAESS